jgi:hypothetical protein
VGESIVCLRSVSEDRMEVERWGRTSIDKILVSGSAVELGHGYGLVWFWSVVDEGDFGDRAAINHRQVLHDR